MVYVIVKPLILRNATILISINTPRKNKIQSEATTVSAPDTSTKRKKITYPENWAEVYPRWKNKEISFKVAMELLGLKQSTFYKLAREYTEKLECEK